MKFILTKISIQNFRNVLEWSYGHSNLRNFAHLPFWYFYVRKVTTTFSGVEFIWRFMKIIWLLGSREQTHWN